MARIKELYTSEIAPALMKKFEYKSVMQIPKLDKIVINVGVGDAKENSKAIDAVIADISAITGQKAVPTYARKSVANFKLREGMKIGVKVSRNASISLGNTLTSTVSSTFTGEAIHRSISSIDTS